MGRLTWRPVRVVEVVAETPRVNTLVLDVPDWPGHRAGQHVDVRLTADDGYRAQRSYSIASAPGDSGLAVTVERIEDGEVSSYLAGEVRAGDEFELRGPIGGYFVWDVSVGGPLLLVAGGSGIVPLMAMVRHRQREESEIPVRLVYSSRTFEDVIYRGELDGLAGTGVEVVHTLTRIQPPDWTGYSRRIDAHLLAEVGFPAEDGPRAYVCGPTRFVESVSRGLGQLGYEPARIKTERFGPTGR